MRYFAILALLVGFSLTGFAQRGEAQFHDILPRGLTSGTAWASYTYANSGADTSQTIKLDGWNHTELVVQVKDSIDLTVSFLPSFDGVTFSPKVAIGTAWDVDVTSGVLVKAFAIPDGYRGCTAVRFELTFDSAGNGVSTPTLDARVRQYE